MIPEETVRHIALLARLGLEKEEVKKMQKDLSAILDSFQELEKYREAGEGASFSGAGALTNAARADRSQTADENTRAVITKNFPASQDNFLKVRSVF